MSKFFETHKLDDNTTFIIGVAGENCILFEGSERALLFDSLTGAGSLKAFVREITDLPVVPVLSHAHYDHEGGFFEYGACYVHPEDIALLYSDFASDVENRLSFVNTELSYAPPHRIKVRREDMVPPCPIRTIPMEHGDRFDLGGRVLEVIHVPGHTRGSVLLLERASRTLFSADAVSPNTLLHLPNSATVEEYRHSLEQLHIIQDSFDRLYNGHSTECCAPSIIEDAINVCDKTLSREDDAIAEEGFGSNCLRALAMSDDFRPVNGGLCNIFYREDHIFGVSKAYREDLEIL